MLKSPPRLMYGGGMAGRMEDGENLSETSVGNVGRPVWERGKRRWRRREGGIEREGGGKANIVVIENPAEGKVLGCCAACESGIIGCRQSPFTLKELGSLPMASQWHSIVFS